MRSLLSENLPGCSFCRCLNKVFAVNLGFSFKRGTISSPHTSAKESGWVLQFLFLLLMAWNSPFSILRPDLSDIPAMAAAVFWVLPLPRASLYSFICSILMGLPDTRNLHSQKVSLGRYAANTNGHFNCHSSAIVIVIIKTQYNMPIPPDCISYAIFCCT